LLVPFDTKGTFGVFIAVLLLTEAGASLILQWGRDGGASALPNGSLACLQLWNAFRKYPFACFTVNRAYAGQRQLRLTATSQNTST
jgi:hypothetical protein